MPKEKLLQKMQALEESEEYDEDLGSSTSSAQSL